ncbi:MAG: FkbM family methyltransferase [Saprospiraceae bacterium]|nr:FkbM family methyltransferase [Saprospiraceae bacterium]
MLSIIKSLIKKLPIAFTRNQQYDAQTVKILKKICHPNANCIDVGCHKGEMLDLILKYAPHGQHYCIEPLPDLFDQLLKKQYPPNCHFYNVALSQESGTTSFNYVVSNPSYSGILRRRYDRLNEEDTLITVRTELLDHIIPENVRIDFIKIDVEGAEMLVLAGGEKTIRRCKPIIVFEHGLGASDVYGTTPNQIFTFFKKNDMKVSLMKDWLSGKPPLSTKAFEDQFNYARNYYFVAHP